jgi:hypothetical protein
MENMTFNEKKFALNESIREMQGIKGFPFDDLVRAIEKHKPVVGKTICDMVRDSKIFRVRDENTPSLSIGEVPTMLPFPTTAIESTDSAGVTLLHIISELDECKDTDSKMYRNILMMHRTQEMHHISFGKFTFNKNTDLQITETVKLENCKLFVVHPKLKTLIDASYAVHTDNSVRELLQSGIQLCLQMVRYINDPVQWIVEEKKEGLIQKRKKIPRSHQRPIYTVLTLPNIRKEYGLKGEAKTGKGTKRGGPRRAHIRTLRNERFGDNIGRKIPIASTWVGPKSAQIGNKVYTVKTNL